MLTSILQIVEKVKMSLQIPLIVRRAEEKDLSAMAEINANVFAGDRDNSESAEEWIRCFFNAFPLYQYFVIEVDGTIAGYIGWQFHGGFLRSAPVIELEQVGISKEYQAQKLGPKLTDESMKEVVKWCRKNNNRIESHIYLIVWGYTHNFNAMKVYFEKFTEGVLGMRRQHGDRTESMLRLKVPALLPIREE
jgi:GNAT superfamily N-acetyltransferase